MVLGVHVSTAMLPFVHDQISSFVFVQVRSGEASVLDFCWTVSIVIDRFVNQSLISIRRSDLLCRVLRFVSNPCLYVCICLYAAILCNPPERAYVL